MVCAGRFLLVLLQHRGVGGGGLDDVPSRVRADNGTGLFTRLVVLQRVRDGEEVVA